MAAETPPPDPEERHITYREYKLDQKSFRWEVRALMLALFVAMNVNVPDEITAAAVILAAGSAIAKGILALFVRFH